MVELFRLLTHSDTPKQRMEESFLPPLVFHTESTEFPQD